MAGFNNQGYTSPKGLHQSSSSNSIKAASASMGPSKTVMYKRRRASRRVPTTILETSCQEFRDAVQKLTGFHRPSSKQSPTKPRPAMAAMPSDSYDEEEEGPERGEPEPEYFHQFLLESSSGGSPQSSGHESPPAAATSRAPPPPSFAAAMRAAAYRQQQQQGQGNAAAAAAAMFGHGMAPPFWENSPFGNDAFMSSLAKLQDPTMAPNPYLIALENQLLAKFARRMQQAATANPLDHPWYQMDHMAPLRA